MPELTNCGDYVLQMENVSKTFPGVKALEGISISILKGEIHAVVGENGAGKSTLIKILSGVHQPDPGAIIAIEGEEVKSLSPLEALRRGIAVIYQDFSLFPNLTVAENIASIQNIEKGRHLVRWGEMRRQAAETLQRLGVKLELEQELGSLSTAKQQLVAIARALTYDARLIVMDEPTSSLSRAEVEQLFNIMRSLRKRGLSILFISHKLDELFVIADRFTVIRDGKCMGTYLRQDMSNQKLISLMVGRNIEYTVYSKRKCTEPLMRVQDFSKVGNFQGISFVLNRGEVLGVTGLVGAGRTELVQSIYGMNPRDSGKLFIDDREIKIRIPTDAVRLGIGYVPQNRLEEGLVLPQTMANNIIIVAIKNLINRLGAVSTYRKGRVVKDAIGRLAIKPPAPQFTVSKLSGGNQQRVVLAKWLITSPKILIVDEPTNGIDVGAKVEIHKILRNLAESGIGVILVSSELPEILAVADRILVMRRGRIAGEFDASTTTQEELMSAAILRTPSAKSSLMRD